VGPDGEVVGRGTGTNRIEQTEVEVERNSDSRSWGGIPFRFSASRNSHFGLCLAPLLYTESDIPIV
jgi:hypothetical protein